jgi:glycosyltransferase involved in cell wall biosynthesis
MSQASISGFTFIRNGVELGFPFEASIRSLLPLVDEFVVVVGKSNDDTLARIHAIGSPKIRVIETIWNERMADRGFVYAQQKMIAQYACTGDWAFYLEGDEVVHEAELANISALSLIHI